MTRYAALVFVALMLAGCGESNDTEDTTLPLMVTRSERTWADASRRTPHTATFPGAQTRTLRTLIWQPGTATPLPLLILAHGFGGLPEKFEALAEDLAAAGYVVAAPAFPLTNELTPGGHDSNLRDLVNQPGDLSFVLDRLLEANATTGDALAGKLVVDQVAVLGHSLGGATVIGLTRKDCCRDERFRTVVSVSAVGALITVFGGDSIAAGPPTLVMHGQADPTVPYLAGQEFYDAIDPPRWFVGLEGVAHSPWLESQVEPPIAERAALERVVIGFLNAQFRGDAAGFARALDSVRVGANEIRS